MKLYLSSIAIPTPDDLAKLLGKSLTETSVALIPNAQDYYSERARSFKNKKRKTEMEAMGFNVTEVDLRDYDEASKLKDHLTKYDLIWASGGNTFCLRYQMKRSGFDTVIRDLLAQGMVYGGDSAGALVAGLSIAGIESADIPEFAEEIIEDGLKLVSHVILPHADNPEFANAVTGVKDLQQGKSVIELKDSQAVIFNDGQHRIVESSHY